MKTRKGTDPKVRPVQPHRDRTKYTREEFKRALERQRKDAEREALKADYEGQ
jgi:hypothetical protein